MASTDVLGETRAGADGDHEREVLESETISSGGSPDELLDAMTRTLATQVIDGDGDGQGSGPGGQNDDTVASPPSPNPSAEPDDPTREVALRQPASLPSPTTPLEVHNSGERGDRAGEVIHERYQLVRMLGKGGMGTVYVARHTALPKTFAVKVLNPRYAKRKDVAERFLQEAQAVSLIEHENVVGVVDFGREADGTAFLVMEHLRGESLKAVIKREAPMTWDRVRHIMDQLCRALQAAHEVGIIHRDIKPDNVIRIGRHNDPDFIKILDFGLAKMQVSGGLRLTQTGMVLGTPDYMSPEQARGRATDHRADIYASGIMMYELLTGGVPFRAKTFQAIRQKHMLEPPDPPSQRAPEAGISEEIDAIVLKALAKQPDERFASMAEMAEAIDAVGTGAAPVEVPRQMPLLAERGVRDRDRPGMTAPLMARPKLDALGETEPLMAKPDVARIEAEAQPAPGPSSAPEPAGSSDKTGLVIGGVLALALLVGAGVWALTLGPLARDPAPAAPPPVADSPPDRPSTHATLRFEGNVPVEIRDLDGVARFGNEPRSELILPRSNQALQLVLHADGYRDLHIVVTPDRDQILEYELLELPPEPEPEPSEDPPTEPVDAPKPRPSKAKPAKPSPPPAEPAPEPEPKPKPADEQADTGQGDEHSFSPEIVDPFQATKE